MNIPLPIYTNARVLVVGDVMLDRYWQGQTTRISPEAPVPIVHIQSQHDRPGAAANVALNVAAIGAQTTLLSVTGDDANADHLMQLLQTHDIRTHFQRMAGLPTIQKLRIMSQHQQLMRLDFEENLTHFDRSKLIKIYENALAETDVVILSDYAKGVLRDAASLIALAKTQGIPVLVDPKGQDFTPYRGATLLTPNRKEFETIVGVCHTEAELVAKGWQLIQTLTLTGLLITRSEAGMTLLVQDQPPLHIPAHQQEIYDVTGAGDTVISILAASLAAGKNLTQAAILANAAAGIVVSHLGAATVSPAELRSVLHHETINIPSGILTPAEAQTAINQARLRQEKVVMTNGCFDILHAGHVQYLTQAKQLGDRLLVAVNDDASIQRLKGKHRPINRLVERMAVLSGLAAVDWVVPFSADTPAELIHTLLPDILVKGADYQLQDIAGAAAVIANGGQVKTLPLVENCSTTKIIATIRDDA